MAKKKIEFEDAEVELEVHEPNVMFIGGSRDASAKHVKEGEEGFVPREPIKGFRMGMKQYRLPDVETQLKGPFYYEDANVLTRTFRKLYKAYVTKGS